MRWGRRREDDVSGGGAYTHMTLLAENDRGHAQPVPAVDLASIEGFYFKPRMDRELLQTYAEGLIATTGCPSGEVQTLLRLGKYDDAAQAAASTATSSARTTSTASSWITGSSIERRAKRDLLRLARQLELPLVATNDLHYTRRSDAEAHAALLCVQSGSTMDDPNRFKFDADDFYLKTADEMRLGLARPAGGLRQHLADRRALSRRVQRERQPDASLRRPGRRDRAVLVRQGGRARACRCATRQGFPTRSAPQAAYEIDVICGKGFPSYFLVVADFISWAKDQDIRVGPGRGSAAGSLVAYALGITDIDPITHGLLFERFLNPERVSMPDIDIDFDERRRGDMIRYVTERYGDDRVAQIVTYGTIKAKRRSRIRPGCTRLAVRDR